MQYSRTQVRDFYSSYFPPGVKWLLIINTAVFVFEYFAAVFFGVDPFRMLGLVPAFVIGYGMIWQLVTYMFLHGGVWHILINMLMLWMFGLDLERDWGTRRFLKYYFLCGIGAGVCVVLIAFVRPSEMYARTIGASGAIFGLLLAYGVLYADRIILLLFLFPMKAKYAVMIFGAIEFLGTWQTGSGVSHVAHLGGMIFGYVYLKTRLARSRRSMLTPIRQQYEDWKLQRARRKFRVYMRKQQSDRDRWVN
jgi:membrane associated rhomboid family serine protease